MTISQRSTVKLRGRQGLLVAAPAMLGFHPQESMVMLCLVGPQRRVGPVMRVDLRPDDGRDDADRDLAATFGEIAWEHADEVALLCYTDSAHTPPFARTVIDELQGIGLHITDAARVTAGRAWTIPAPPPGTDESDFADEDDGCEVPDGQDPQVQMMAAAIALNGRGILPDRPALRRSIDGPTGQAAVRASAALRAAVHGFLGTEGVAFGRRRLHRMAEHIVDAALDESTSGSLSPATTSQLVLLLRDHRARDEVIVHSLVDTQQPWLPMLIAAARAVPDEYAAEICAVLAVAAYGVGDGALAQVAVDRCRRVEPGHGLARLMLEAMNTGLRPAALFDALVPDLDLSPGKGG
ncbi:protein of unknown function [Nakamurella panacisegetis]|uniref:DUF4192 domain-containing protein n=1 Tax=Nakamurella panacisegetis TaxID=1090615 RepID=A0A1H0SMK1_9ACTN|nr:DUF4192 domain-containing protein [Nakamurella panacisegetis]SDP42974.1 protein of unknown function [Nakamurella panacisegetis]